MTSKSYSKDDLKRLMQERKEEQSKKRIDSPLAYYDKNGNLCCKICELKIDNVNLWTKHLVSKEHKMCLDRIKKGQSINQQQQKPNEMKRKLTDESTNEISKNKQIKIDSADLKKEKEIEDNKKNESSQLNKEESNENSDLPKGFFDNPEEDAKARDEIFKDPLDEEYSKFQRTMQEEDKIVDNIVEADQIETQNYRELTEIDEQLEHWNRINQLEIKREAMKSIKKKMEIYKNESNDENSSDESDLIEDFDILSNWRCKKA